MINCRMLLRGLNKPSLTQAWMQSNKGLVTDSAERLTEKIDAMTAIEKTLNQVSLLGRVGNEPQKRGTEENPVVIFSLATHMNYKYDSGDLMQKTEWHRICVFKQSLRNVVYQYLHKGQRVYISGRITYGEVNIEGGTSRPTTAIVADEVIFLQGGKQGPE